jgi:hypothetical protein
MFLKVNAEIKSLFELAVSKAGRGNAPYLLIKSKRNFKMI